MKNSIKTTKLPVENSADAGSKGKFQINKAKQLPKEMPTGDAGSKGLFITKRFNGFSFIENPLN